MPQTFLQNGVCFSSLQDGFSDATSVEGQNFGPKSVHSVERGGW